MNRDDLARASTGLAEAEWAALVESDNPFDGLTVLNACAIADNILRAFPQIATVEADCG